ncbi:MAG TPA: uridine kinase [Bacteroidales bacterium]|nr:uridine kinase [Bacteroidales bacterium]
MFIIGIAGGTGCGKTTVVRKIIENLPENQVAVIPQDSYYRDNSHIPDEERQKINFDHPSSLEFPLLVEHIRQLKKGEKIEQPVYSYLTCTRSDETIPVEPKKVIIVEGILIFTHEPLRKICDLKVYVDADADDRLSRVIYRDITERGRTVDVVLDRYHQTVKPMHLQFIEPTKRYADIIVPQGGNNTVAINVLSTIIQQRLALQ